MKNVIRRTIVRVLRPYRAIERRRTIGKLLNHGDAQVKSIGEAIQETIENYFEEDESRWIRSIENRREQLSRSTVSVPSVDYGAGTPESHRSKEEMDQGIARTALVSKIVESSKPEFSASFLFKLIRKIRPSSSVELGSCVGISAAYQAAAMKLNGNGFLMTLEGSPGIAGIASDTLNGLGLDNAKVVVGPFQRTLDAALKQSTPIDFFFNDGHHDRDAVLKYYRESMPYLSATPVIVFDDIAWSKGMKEAWSQIVNDPLVAVSIGLGGMGIALVRRNAAKKEHFSMRF